MPVANMSKSAPEISISMTLRFFAAVIAGIVSTEDSAIVSDDTDIIVLSALIVFQ